MTMDDMQRPPSVLDKANKPLGDKDTVFDLEMNGDVAKFLKDPRTGISTVGDLRVTLNDENKLTQLISRYVGNNAQGQKLENDLRAALAQRDKEMAEQQKGKK